MESERSRMRILKGWQQFKISMSYFQPSLTTLAPSNNFLAISVKKGENLIWSSHGLLLNSIFFFFLLDRFVLASYALQVFLHTMIISCCCVSGDSCSYVSRTTQILELGVSEFCSTVPNSHVKSRFCFRVLSRNSQRGRL